MGLSFMNLLIFLSLAVFIFGLHNKAQAETEYELVSLGTNTCHHIYPLDWDGDGRDEFLVLGQAEVSLSSCFGKASWSFYVTRPGDMPWCTDNYSYYHYELNGGRYRLILTYRKIDSIFAFIREGEIKSPRHSYRRLLLAVRPRNLGTVMPNGSGWLVSPQLLDVNDDGREDLVGYWNTWLPWKAQFPRGLAAYDLETGQELWHFWLGGSISHDLIVSDLDGDGKKEIVAATTSPSNGGQANGTDDNHAYVIAFNRRGRRLWQREMGGYFSKAGAREFVNSQGVRLLLCWSESYRGQFDRADELMFLRPRDGTLVKKVECGEYISGLAVADLDNDDKMEIIAGNSDGKIRIYNEALEMKSEYWYKEGMETRVKQVYDLDGDGYKEIIAIGRDRSILILAHSLTVKAQQYIDQNIDWLHIIRTGKKGDLLTFKNIGEEKYQATLWGLRLKPEAKKQRLFNIIGWCALIAIASAALFYGVRAGNKAAAYAGALRAIRHCGLVVIDSRGYIEALTGEAEKLLGVSQEIVGKKVDRIEPLATLWKILMDKRKLGQKAETVYKHGEEGKKLEAVIYSRAGREFLLVNDCGPRESAEKLKSWVPVAQQMAHGIKTPLTTILLAVEKISRLNRAGRSRKEIATLCSAIESEVNRLKKNADSFMRFLSLELPEKTAADVTSLIERIIDRIQINGEQMPTFRINVEHKLPLVPMDIKLMEVAISNIIDNAVAAAGNQGRVEIDISCCQVVDSELEYGHLVKIEIKDNGPGIPLAYKNTLFKPFFTTKESGAGLGLVTSKKIIEDHGGSISIDSKERVGTVVTILLPAAGDQSPSPPPGLSDAVIINEEGRG